MENGIDKLKNIGAQTIYETTHISKANIQALIHESFESFSSVQFLGFISILEKEYNVDLSELKQKGLSEIEQNVHDISTDTLFLDDEHKKSNKSIYIILIFFLTIFTLYFYISNKPKNRIENIEPTMQEVLEKEIKQDTVEQPTFVEKKNEHTKELGIEKNATKKEITNEKKIVENKETTTKHILKIETKNKLWIGYIELPSYKKHQQTFQGSLNIDPNKEWLILTAHGYITLNVDSNLQTFQTNHRLRFLYKDHKLKQLTLKEFKQLNREKAW